MSGFDAIVVGGGLMGSATALFLARAGMRTALIERDAVCRSASGINAGTLTMHMTRAALIPYAMRGWHLWTTASDWLGHSLGVVQTPGLCLAFTDAEAELLEQRSLVRRDAGAEIELISTNGAREIEPGLSDRPKLVAHCRMDGHVPAYLTGRAFHAALTEAGCSVVEYQEVMSLANSNGHFEVMTRTANYKGKQLVLAGGVWLENMLGHFGVNLPIKTLVNQLTVTERMAPVMRSVITIASGLLSLKQFGNGTAVIGGGWQGIGNRDTGETSIVPESVIGNARLATYAIPALRSGRILRSWAGFEAETADAMPLLGPLPGIEGAFVIGSVHSGYTSGPYMAQLLADRILGREPDMPLFPIDRLLRPQSEGVPA